MTNPAPPSSWPTPAIRAPDVLSPTAIEFAATPHIADTSPASEAVRRVVTPAVQSHLLDKIRPALQAIRTDPDITADARQRRLSEFAQQALNEIETSPVWNKATGELDTTVGRLESTLAPPPKPADPVAAIAADQIVRALSALSAGEQDARLMASRGDDGVYAVLAHTQPWVLGMTPERHANWLSEYRRAKNPEAAEALESAQRARSEVDGIKRRTLDLVRRAAAG